MSASLLRQLAPLEIDSTTKEPFLRLPVPYSHIIITPPRASDAERIVDCFNDPRVFRWTVSPPWPYLLEHANGWLEMVKAETDTTFKRLEDAADADPDGTAPLALTSLCPVRSIRERKADGTDFYLGDCGFMLASFIWEPEEKVRAELIKGNATHPVGSPDIIWSIGDYLLPSHHGQGIMSAVVKTLLEQWAIPRMNVRCIRPVIFEGNEGSLRVFYKNGFTLWKTIPDALLSKAKGKFPEEMRGIHIVEYSRA